MQVQDFRLRKKLGVVSVSRKKAGTEEAPDENGAVVKKKTTRTSKRASTRTRKKAMDNNLDENPELAVVNDATSDESIVSASIDDSKKPRQRARRKGIFLNCNMDVYFVP